MTSNHTEAALGLVPLAVATRNGAVESVHHGVLVATAADGSVLFAWGDAQRIVYPRSALKPLQASAMVGAGLDLDDRHLAVACGSHDGTPNHVAVVTEILAGAGLGVDALRNTPDLPLDESSAFARIRGGGGRQSITQNCSGKHAAMLATCVANGWPLDGYLSVDHPVQRLIDTGIERLAGGVHHTGIDGCGAPTAMVSLAGLARSFGRLASTGSAVAAAMSRHPELVGGEVRHDTALMRLVPGAIVKDGAEGVQAVGLPDGRALAVKIADGANRAMVAVTLAALDRLGVAVDRSGSVLDEPVLGHGRPVGSIEAIAQPD